MIRRCNLFSVIFPSKFCSTREDLLPIVENVLYSLNFLLLSPLSSNISQVRRVYCNIFDVIINAIDVPDLMRDHVGESMYLC